MEIEQTGIEIIIRLSALIDKEALKELLNRINYLEAKSESKVTEEEIRRIAEDITLSGPTENRLLFSDFSFSKSRKALEDYKGSFSDAVIEERRAEL